MALGPCHPQPLYFLHRIYNSGVKIRPPLKKSYLFHKIKKVKS